MDAEAFAMPPTTEIVDYSAVHLRNAMNAPSAQSR
jgi:hypothetical protein